MAKDAPLKTLVKEEIRRCLKEYFHTTQANRQIEVQEYLSRQVDQETLRELCREPRLGREYVRSHHNEKFYWWANEDVENLFRNWQ